MTNLEVFFEDLVAHEGCTQYLYCDNRGFVTVGVGHLVRGPEDASAMPFFAKDGREPTQEQKRAAYIRVQDAFNPKLSAAAYAKLTDLRLTPEYVRTKALQRLAHEFIPAILKECRGFDQFPEKAQRVLVDIAYNCGTAGFGDFDNMIRYANAGDWEGCARSCHRKRKKGESEARNEWAARLFTEAARGIL